jgi:hypothetical protein
MGIKKEKQRSTCNRISSICRKHLPVLSSFMTYHRVCNQIDTTGATSGAGTTYPSRAPECTLILYINKDEIIADYINRTNFKWFLEEFEYTKCIVRIRNL